MAESAIDWHARAATAAFDGRALIDAARCDAVVGETFVKASPIDGRVLGPVARCRAADIDAAVRSARAAFDDGRWCGKPPAARKKILQRFAEQILAARDELALLETLDMGKPIQYSLAVDVPATARTASPGTPRPSTRSTTRSRPPALRAGADHARADGRDRRRRALELPDDHGGVEARPGAGHRQLRGA